MFEEEGGPVRITNPMEVEDLVETLTLPGAASLLLEQSGSDPLPIVVVSATPGEAVVFDATALGEHVPAIQRSEKVRLLGQGIEGMVRTPLLALHGCEEVDGRIHCRCEYPRTMEQFQRRDTYRAALRMGMHVGVLVRDLSSPLSFQGDLRDLSMNGCLVELSPTASEVLDRTLELELCFPNAMRFVIRAESRHYTTDNDRGLLAVGFAFAEATPEQDRQLWYYVREIERETARGADAENSSLQPSVLFQSKDAEPSVGLRNALPYATPMARRLARVAGYLDNQVLELRDGGVVDPAALSRAADRLLDLRDDDRQALLFALVCLPHDPQIVQHSLAVAVRLVDIGQAFKMPRDLLKALAACALVHDLGKVLLSRAALEAGATGDGESGEYRQHVALLRPRLARCQWLAGAVREAVVEGANERLDGSGYPHRWRGEELHELTRLAAVVIEIDRLGRPMPGHSPMPVDQIRARLEREGQRFDPQWVARYFGHFGPLPVGTLLRFPGGELGWVVRLDERGGLARIQMTEALAAPADNLGEIMEGASLERLGEPEALTLPAREGALYC